MSENIIGRTVTFKQLERQDNNEVLNKEHSGEIVAAECVPDSRQNALEGGAWITLVKMADGQLITKDANCLTIVSETIN